MTTREEIFVKITNRNIYDKLCDIENNVKETNGKVRLNRWIATTSLTITLSVVLALIGMRVIG